MASGATMSSTSNMNQARKFAANTRWAMLAKVVSAGISIPFLILLPRFLGVQVYGQFAIAVSALIFLRLLSGGGLGYATGRRLAASEAEDGARGSILAAGLSLQILLALAVGTAFFLAAGPVGSFISRRAGSGQDLAPLLRVVALAVAFFAINEFAKAAFQGLQRFHYLTLVTTIEYAGKLILVVGLAWAGYGVTGAFAGFTVALFLAAATGLFLLRRVGWSRPTARIAQWKDLYLYNVPLMLTSAGFIVYTELDTLMLGYFSGFAETGLYAAAKSIARAAPLFAVPFGQAAAPLIVRMVRDAREEAAEFVNRLLRYVGAVFIPIAAAVAVTAPYLVRVWGPGFGGAALPLRVMSLFLISISFGVVITAILDYLGEAPRRARWMMISIVFNIGLNLVLIPRYGALGAALSTVLTHGPFVLNNLRLLAQRIGLSSRRLAGGLAPIVGASLAAAGAATLALSWRAELVVGLIAGAAVYLGLIFAFGIVSRAELAEVIKLVTGTGRRGGPSEPELVSESAES